MFYYLMFANFAIALIVSITVVLVFGKSIDSILARVINDPINTSWAKYTKFAGMVVGVSSGIRIYDMEKYITPIVYNVKENYIVQLTTERWFLEIYRTIIETLQGLAWMLLVFYVIALFSYVIVRWSEVKTKKE